MSATLQFITLCPVINQGASQCPLSGEASSPPCVYDKQGIEDRSNCGEGGKIPQFM